MFYLFGMIYMNFIWRVIQVFAEQVELFLGSDEISPPLELGPFTFTSWSEISQVCGDSRVWGGMHFKVSFTRDGNDRA